jgi:uncharacterized protein (TIGR02246 family)
VRSTVALLLLLLLLPAAAQRQRRQPSPSSPSQPSAEDRLLADQRAITRLQERDIAANTALDLDALVSLTTDDVVVLPPGRPPVVGQKALRAFYQGLVEKTPDAQVLAYSEEWDEVRILGDYAFQWGTITERTMASVTAAESSSAVHAMRILARQPDGSWKIARFMWNAAPAAATH